ncbi:MAG TPA: PIG-L family deacetylase [Opitutaceae bacterium]|jgi:LmbE family N-acetylglucosaminyl deacetylase|nr:PIG-L family deacetylase [Opitutaceae bacterium]
MTRTDTKRRLRQIAIRLCRGLLRLWGRCYVFKDGMTVVFAPHQDDETIGCGGLIARKRHEGLPVHVVFITDGCLSHPEHPELTPVDIAEIRRTEAFNALAVLGVESSAIHFLNERDGSLSQLGRAKRDALVGKLAALLDDIRPDEIFLPCHHDGSDEHTATFTCVSDALRHSPRQPEVWQYPVWAWWKPYFLLKNLFLSGAAHRLPMEDFQPLKFRALECYRSQAQPTSPWNTSVLPAELRAPGEFAEEYFFGFNLPAPAKNGDAKPPVI